jgi:hypothetical protein
LVLLIDLVLRFLKPKYRKQRFISGISQEQARNPDMDFFRRRVQYDVRTAQCFLSCAARGFPSPYTSLALLIKINYRKMSLILKKLAEIGRRNHSGSNSGTIAVVAPPEDERLPMRQRGVRLVMLRNLLSDLKELERGDINSGQFLNGIHTKDSATDWKEFNRDLDEYSGKACCLHTGLSFVETMISAGMINDPNTGEEYFSNIDTFVSYTWRGENASLCALVASVEDALTADGIGVRCHM